MATVISFATHSHVRVSSAVVFLCHQEGEPSNKRLGTCQLEGRSTQV
jgi:hypothetical protein